MRAEVVSWFRELERELLAVCRFANAGRVLVKVEVGGVEPPSSEFYVGLLRAQPVGRSRIRAAHRRPAWIPASL